MEKRKLTKKALLTSVISLILCFAMLVGTTFAWFTDNVTSTGNRIIAGNLEIDLLMDKDGIGSGGYTSIAEGSGNIFDEGITANNSSVTLWEPGKTQVVYLAIENKGNLDLKYMVNIKAYKDADNAVNPIDMSPVMKYAITPNAKAGDVTKWNSANAKSVQLGLNADATDVALKEGETHYFALSVHMDEEAGNEYKNASIIFDLVVDATQLNSESDSFDSDYDKNAKYDVVAPVAKVTNLGTDYLADTTNSKMGVDLGVLKLNTAYQFEPTMSYTEAQQSEMKDWHADFVVSVDKDIPANSIALAGYYNAWCQFNNDKWVAFTSDAPVSANQQIRLVELMGVTVSYEELCNFGNDGIGFRCGAVELNNLLPANTTLTVQLRLYKATGGSLSTETGEYIVASEYSYTFK